jgi:hypothetical protein
MHVAFSRPASACGCAMATSFPAVPPCEGEGRLGPPLVNGDGDGIPGFPPWAAAGGWTTLGRSDGISTGGQHGRRSSTW